MCHLLACPASSQQRHNDGLEQRRLSPPSKFHQLDSRWLFRDHKSRTQRISETRTNKGPDEVIGSSFSPGDSFSLTHSLPALLISRILRLQSCKSLYLRAAFQKGSSIDIKSSWARAPIFQFEILMTSLWLAGSATSNLKQLEVVAA